MECPHCGKRITSIDKIIQKYKIEYSELDSVLQNIWDELKTEAKDNVPRQDNT